MRAGCRMAIAHGTDEGALAALAAGGRATWFTGGAKPQLARKHWIAAAVHLPGAVVVDDGAAKALAEGKSLLPAGVVAVEGSFERGDIIAIKHASGGTLAKGISGYSAAEAARIVGKKTDAIAEILGYAARRTLIHRDDLAVL